MTVEIIQAIGQYIIIPILIAACVFGLLWIMWKVG
jgi:hypothetical protein